MQVNRLSVDRFRNLQPQEFLPVAGVNIIAGENAQGKTNLLEALWLFTGSKSFRGSKDSELTAFGESESHLTLEFHGGNREQNAAITIRARRSATLNGVTVPSATRLAGTFCGIVFSPAHLSLIKGGPAERRRFMDAAYCQLRPAYVQTLTDYQRVLTQRNALCRTGEPGKQTEELLSLWDYQLAQTGCRIVQARRRYLQKLSSVAADIYRGLSAGRENLQLSYQPTEALAEELTVAQLAEQLYAQLQTHHREDLAAGFTTVGPHRDDMIVEINEISARSYGSQGQQRSAVLAVKLAEATLLEEVIGEPPIALLDDVMSELDCSRQEYILNHLQAWQVFITCCDPAPLARLRDGSRFWMKNGKLSTEKT